MEDLRVIADEAQEGVDGYYTSPFMVLKDGPIKKVEDLKGKIVGDRRSGCGGRYRHARRCSRRAGLEDKRDYTVVEARFPNMRALLADKKADLITSVLPFSIDPELVEDRKPAVHGEGCHRAAREFIVWAARDGFLQKNKAAMNDFMEDSAARVALLDGPEEPRRSCWKSRPASSKLPAAAFASWMYTKNDLYRDPNFSPDLDCAAARDRCAAGRSASSKPRWTSRNIPI